MLEKKLLDTLALKTRSFLSIILLKESILHILLWLVTSVVHYLGVEHNGFSTKLRLKKFFHEIVL